VGYRFVTNRSATKRSDQRADGEPRGIAAGLRKLTNETAMIAADVVTAFRL